MKEPTQRPKMSESEKELYDTKQFRDEYFDGYYEHRRDYDDDDPDCYCE